MPEDREPTQHGRADPQQLAEALERLRPRLHAFVRRHAGAVVRAHESCEDLVQSVCREVIANAGRLTWQGDEAFRAWLFTWAANKLRDRQRHWLAHKRDVRREQALPDGSGHDGFTGAASSATPSREAMLHERMEQIEVAFARLPPQYREVITLSRVAGLSHAEIAERLHSTPGAVRTQLNRALVRLSSELDRTLPGDGA